MGLITALKSRGTKRIKEEVKNNRTRWLFNPPGSPWMSWAIESMMKATKCALKTIMKERTFTDDALYMIMAEVESIINSRPLANVSDKSDDYKVLTLNHFCWNTDPITFQLLTMKKLI